MPEFIIVGIVPGANAETVPTAIVAAVPAGTGCPVSPCITVAPVVPLIPFYKYKDNFYF